MVLALGAGEVFGASKGLAIFHTLCGDFDAAHWYESAIAERDSFVVAFLQGSIGAPMRASRHWHKLAAQMNLPEAAKALGT